MWRVVIYKYDKVQISDIRSKRKQFRTVAGKIITNVV